MSSFDSIYKKIASSLEQGGAGHAQESKVDPARHIAPAVAHELNNILTIIQGYADRLLLRHQNDQTLEPHLKLIDRKSTRLNSSHANISYAVFCLKKKTDNVIM